MSYVHMVNSYYDQERKENMKRFLCLIMLFAMMFSLTACGDNNEQSEEETNPLTEKIYMHNDTSHREEFDFSYIKFYDDNTCQGVNGDKLNQKNEPQYVSYYGTYEIKGNSITMDIGNESFSGVIKEDGHRVNFGKEGFVDWTEHIRETDSLLSAFDQ